MENQKIQKIKKDIKLAISICSMIFRYLFSPRFYHVIILCNYILNKVLEVDEITESIENRENAITFSNSYWLGRFLFCFQFYACE